MEHNYNKLYKKYKSKYINLKNLINQKGGDIITDLSGLNWATTIKSITKVKDDFLTNDIKKDDFYTVTELDKLLALDNFNINFINKMIITNIFMLSKPLFYFDLIKENTDYYKNIEILFVLTKLMHQHILEHIEKNTNTILLVPGDSPSYFLFIIKILHPELFSNPKLTVIEFPISSIGGAMKKEYIDGTPYISYLINKYIPSEKLLNEHNYLIFDYSESGDSVNYIKTTISKIYKSNLTYNVGKEILMKDIDISHYFLPQYIDQFVEYNKIKAKQEPLINPLQWPIIKNKIRTNLFSENFPRNFPEEYPSFALNNRKLLEYLVDDSKRRCQYKLKMDKANDFVLKNKESGIDIKNYYCEFIEGKFDYSLCNILFLLFYIYLNKKESLETQTKEIQLLLMKNKLM